MSLIDNCKIPLKNITFIGHSLGSHVCGFASKKLQESKYGVIPRLIAADPAQPLFSLNECNNRLCISDAEVLTALHTSTLGLPFAVGKTDLYFHGGYTQPKCKCEKIDYLK